MDVAIKSKKHDKMRRMMLCLHGECEWLASLAQTMLNNSLKGIVHSKIKLEKSNSKKKKT